VTVTAQKVAYRKWYMGDVYRTLHQI